MRLLSTPVGAPRRGGGATDELVTEWVGWHALIRHHAEAAPERRILTRPLPDGDTVVLATERAHRARSLPAAVLTVLDMILSGDPARRPRRLWLAVSDIGNVSNAGSAWLARLAHQSGVEIRAPHGPLIVLPDGTLYVGLDPAASGWLRYHSGPATVLVAKRWPAPAWDLSLPRSSIVVDGAVGEPAPAGLFVRHPDAPSLRIDEPAAAVPPDNRRAKLILGRPGEPTLAPAAVAAVLTRLRAKIRASVVLVPCQPELVTGNWLHALAEQLGHDVTTTTGPECVDETGRQWTLSPRAAGRPTFRPFATVLRQSPGNGPVEIMDCAVPPDGWSSLAPGRFGMTGSVAGGAVVADVVPNGLVLRQEPTRPVPGGAFDPTGWTLTVAGPMTDRLLAGVRCLLRDIGSQQARAGRIVVNGPLADEFQQEIRLLAVQHGMALVSAPARSARARPPAEPTRPIHGVDFLSAANTTEPIWPPPDAETPPTPELAAQRPPIAVSSGPPPPLAVESSGRPIAVPALELTRPLLPNAPRRSVPPPDPATQAPSTAAPEPPPTIVEVEDRPSTAAEREQFTAAAGARFTEALAVVNASFAAWPVMRSTDPAVTKPDYVAVCLYLGTGESGAAELNAALRQRRAPIPGLTPCLVSGLRRLPTHRRCVLRQGAPTGQVEQHYPVDALLTEPGFISASAELDVTTPESTVDFLIWPRSARHTSMLGMRRPFEEVLFLAGTRFKVLAVRGTESESEANVPKTAVLLRELLPQEIGRGSIRFDEVDRAALSKLDSALAGRRGAPARLLEDADAVGRLTGSFVHVDGSGTQGSAG